MQNTIVIAKIQQSRILRRGQICDKIRKGCSANNRILPQMTSALY